jgi:hypothetical protein
MLHENEKNTVSETASIVTTQPLNLELWSLHGDAKQTSKKQSSIICLLL